MVAGIDTSAMEAEMEVKEEELMAKQKQVAWSWQ